MHVLVGSGIVLTLPVWMQANMRLPIVAYAIWTTQTHRTHASLDTRVTFTNNHHHLVQCSPWPHLQLPTLQLHVAEDSASVEAKQQGVPPG